jgi:hypothetical protein
MNGEPKMKSRFRQTAVALGFVCFMVGSVSAQTFCFQSLPKDRPQLGCRFLHPFFDAPDIDLSAVSGIYELYANIPVSPRINLVGSIPFITMKYEYPRSEYGYDESGMGNIHIGMQYHPAAGDNRSSNVAFGVFLPTASDELRLSTWELSLLSMFTDNHSFYKYWPDIVTVHGNIATHSMNPGGTLSGTEIGAYFVVPTEGSGDTEVFMRYGLTGGLHHRGFAIFAELLGIAIVTEGDMDFADRFDHEVTFGAQWLRGPGVFYKIYLDEANRDVVSGVLGIKVEVVL